jgi:hypothetical protein
MNFVWLDSSVELLDINLANTTVTWTDIEDGSYWQPVGDDMTSLTSSDTVAIILLLRLNNGGFDAAAGTAYFSVRKDGDTPVATSNLEQDINWITDHVSVEETVICGVDPATQIFEFQLAILPSGDADNRINANIRLIGYIEDV